MDPDTIILNVALGQPEMEVEQVKHNAVVFILNELRTILLIMLAALARCLTLEHVSGPIRVLGVFRILRK